MAQALDYGKIKDSCSNLTNLAGDIGTTVDNVNSAISKITDPAWVGKASEAYRDKIKTLADHLPEANRQLAESIIFLASCADAYDQLDKDAVKKLKDLIGGQDYIDKYDVNSAPDVDLNSRYGEEDKGDENKDPSDTPESDTPKGTSCGGCGGCGSSGGSCGSSGVAPTPATTPATTPPANDITALIKALDCTDIDLDKATEETKALFKDKNFKYDKDGFARLGEYYLIECDSSVAKVGEVIKFTLSDGTAVSCIVAANTKDVKDKEKIKFIMEKDKMSKAKETEIIKKLLTTAQKIENMGPYSKATTPGATTTSTDDTGTTDSTSDTGTTGSTSDTGVKTRGNVIDVSSPVKTGEKYNLSDDDVAYLAYVAKREQGSVAGSKLELSLMCNLYEKSKGKYKSVVDYVKNSGWFAKDSTSSYQNPGADYVNAAKEVITEGNRYLPDNVVEHDCLSDITSISTGSVSNSSNYIPGKTVIKNRYGAKYVFVGFAPNGGDPFGYKV